MALNPDSWKRFTEDLEPGRSCRVDHDCGGGRTLSVTNEGSRFKAWCHRCNEGGQIKGPEESLTQKLARIAVLQSADIASRGSTDLPEPRVTTVADWPDLARLWFYRAGLSAADIGRLGAYYHPPTRRVVLPVMQQSVCRFWQARALERGQVPKYLAPDVEKAYPKWGESRDVTLTEDILSAYKVGLVGEGWCMLGTSLPDQLLGDLMRRRCRVNVWLDNDLPPLHPVNRGQIAAAKVGAKLRAMGLETRNIVSPRDPKLMTRAEIKELLSWKL